mmetsp:Transcript_7705/g.18383  ORF Transcript_7705/g.18383 Transcript_7705/m.18383 type:complete len:222 (-) Transcript_7705:136-801(-)
MKQFPFCDVAPRPTDAGHVAAAPFERGSRATTNTRTTRHHRGTPPSRPCCVLSGFADCRLWRGSSTTLSSATIPGLLAEQGASGGSLPASQGRAVATCACRMRPLPRNSTQGPAGKPRTRTGGTWRSRARSRCARTDRRSRHCRGSWKYPRAGPSTVARGQAVGTRAPQSQPSHAHARARPSPRFCPLYSPSCGPTGSPGPRSTRAKWRYTDNKTSNYTSL